MSEQRSNLAIFTIFMTVVGIIVLLQSQSIGLTIIFLAILFYAGTIVRNRLERIGAESFALGSIIVWTGFFLAAFPLIAFAWNVLDRTLQTILFISGLILIFIGFTTEYYDLNIRFLQFLRKFRANLVELVQALRQRIFRSIWTFLALVSIILTVTSAIFPDYFTAVPHPFNFAFGVSLEFFLLTLIFMAIQLRSIIKLTLIAGWETVELFFIVIWSRLKNFPKLFKDFLSFIYHLFRGVLEWFWRTFAFIRYNSFLLAFIGVIVFGTLAISQADEILGGIAIVFLLIAMVNIIGERREAITNRVGQLQQSAYRRSFSLRNLIRGSYSGNCPNCHHELRADQSYCQNCGTYIPDCLICRNTIYAGEETLTCPNCQYIGHADHLERWLSIRPICPNCKEEWK